MKLNHPTKSYLSRLSRRLPSCSRQKLLYALCLSAILLLGYTVGSRQAASAFRNRAAGIGAIISAVRPSFLESKYDDETDQAPPRQLARYARSACARLARPLSDTNPRVITPFLVDEAHGFTVCCHAKVASSYFLLYIHELNGKNVSKFTRNSQIHPSAHHLWGDNRRSFEDLDAQYKFQIVRHPFRRLVSTYINKIIDQDYFARRHFYERIKTLKDLPTVLKDLIPLTLWNDMENSTTIKNRRDLENYLEKYDLKAAEIKDIPENGEYLSFSQFTHLVLRSILHCKDDPSCLKWTDIHFQPQWVRCDPCALEYDAILKVETLPEDMRYLRETLILPDLDEVIKDNLEIAKLRDESNKKMQQDEKPNESKSVQNVKPDGKQESKMLYMNGAKSKYNPEKQMEKQEVNQESNFAEVQEKAPRSGETNDTNSVVETRSREVEFTRGDSGSIRKTVVKVNSPKTKQPTTKSGRDGEAARRSKRAVSENPVEEQKKESEPAINKGAVNINPVNSERVSYDYDALLAELSPLARDLLFSAYRHDFHMFDYRL